jgi:predicted nuclease of restriction endonuclease-like (RecB) superfamily
MGEFPEVNGFSVANLKYVRQWVEFWRGSSIGQQAVGQLSSGSANGRGQQPVAESAGDAPVGLLTIPWGHNLVILAKCKDHEQARFYVRATIEHGWSRATLVHQIESDLWRRQGAAQTNFPAVLPAADSALATQTLKDPYVFDFLTLGTEHDERELERGLVAHITQFLIELGAGFAYVGRPTPPRTCLILES